METEDSREPGSSHLITHQELLDAYRRKYGDRKPEDVMAEILAKQDAETKQGARHSASDQKMLQTIHDHATALGAGCPPEGDGAGKTQPPGAKSTDLDAWSQRVRTAFYEEFSTNSPYGPVNDWWVERVFDDAVIICTGGTDYYRAPYTMDGAEVSFARVNEWEQVERTYAPVKSDATLIVFGGTLKAVAGDKFEGLLVKFSTEDDPDLTGDYFTKDTDFGVEDGTKTPIYFHHRLPMKTRDGGEIRIKSKVGEGIIRFKDDGAYLEDAILYNRTEYEKAIRNQAAKGMFGLSSGTASHFVEREFTGKAWKITEWLLGIDASVTPTPAEPRTFVLPVKALPATKLTFDIPDPEATTPEADATTSAVSGAAVKSDNGDGTSAQAPISLEDFDMNEEQLNKLLGLVEAQGTAIKTQGEQLAEIKAKWNEPPDNKGGQLHDAKKGSKAPAMNKTPLGDDAFKAFNWFLKTGDPSGIRTGEAYEEMLQDRNLKTTYSLLEGTQYQGQEAVPTEVLARIIERRDPISIMRAAGAEVIPVGSNAVVLPIEKNSPENFVITTIDGSNTFDQTTQQPMDKLAATIYMFTKSVPIDIQLLDDSVVNIEAWWGRRMGRAWALTENAYFLMGTGSGQPGGAIYGGTSAVTAASATAVTAAELVSLYHKLPAEYRDNVAWAMRGATEGAVRALGAPQYGFAFVGNGGFNGGAGNTGQPQGRGWLVDPGSKVFNSDGVDALAASKKPISVFNAEAGYAIFERKGLTIFRDPYSLSAKGMVNVLAYFRESGGVTNAVAIQNLVTPSA